MKNIVSIKTKISNFIIDVNINLKEGINCFFGPSGAGKTSIIKAIANNHQLPIFNLDLSSVKNNTDLLKLVTDINCISNDISYSCYSISIISHTSRFGNFQ